MSTSPQLAPGQVFAGDFLIVRKLAEGGMGSLYVAEQRSTGEQRALKLMLPQLLTDTRLVERFLQEARVGARIRSEHVVKVVAAGVDADSGAPWYAMELLEGADLEATLRQRGPFSPGEVLEYLQQVCHALAMAHAAGVIHRDLKPENLFLTRSQRADGRPTVKVLDFGIAKVLQENRTSASATGVLGTPLWMAPEQSTAEPVRPAADVWALALIAFYLLTGRSYWRGAHAETFSLQVLFREVLFDPMVPASQRARELGAAPLPAGFDALFARCTDRDPMQRPHDAGAFVALLPAALATHTTASQTYAPAAPPAASPTPAPVALPAQFPTHPAFVTPPAHGPSSTHPAFATPSPVAASSLGTAPTAAMSAFAMPLTAPPPTHALPPARRSFRPWALLPLGVLLLAGAGLVAQRFLGDPREHPRRREPLALRENQGDDPSAHFVEPPIRLALTPRAQRVEAVVPAPAVALNPEPGATPDASAAPATSDDPLPRALECARNGDQHCVVDALRSHASSEQALALLVAAERALGQRQQAEASMRRYLGRYPAGPRAAAYRAQLGPGDQGVQLLDTQGRGGAR